MSALVDADVMAESVIKSVRFYLAVPWNWLLLTAHNTWGILNVVDIIWLRPMPGG
jgi:hypothetical protein